MSNPIQTPPESYLINSPEVQEVIHNNVTKDMIWQPSSIVGKYDKGTIVWFSDDRYVKKNNNANNDTPPQDNIDDWMHISDYIAQLFNVGYPNKMPQLNQDLSAIATYIQELLQNQFILQEQINTVNTDLTNVKTVCTNYTDKVFVRENTINDEVLVSNNVFTDTSNVCKIPSPNGNVLEKWICYSNEADGFKLYIKNIADINGSGTKVTDIGGKNPRMYNNSELLYIAVDGTYKDRIMKKNAFVLSDGVARGNNTNKAYNFCVANINNAIVLSLISTDTNLDQRLHLLRTDGSMLKLNTDKVTKVDYKHGYLFFINQNQNYKLYKKTIQIDGSSGTLISQYVTECNNLFTTIDNLLIYEAEGVIYSKRDIDVSDGAIICNPSSAAIHYKLGCDLGGGEAIIFKETASAGQFLMYRKKLFIHV